MNTPLSPWSDRPAVSVEAMQRLMAGELSLRARLGYTALLLVSTAVGGAIGALWLTEPALPVRAHAAFAVIVGIAICWIVFAIRVLTQRHVLLARHRVTAARMSVAFSTVMVVGVAAVAYSRGAGPGAYAAAGVGLVMLAVAGGMLVRANRQVAWLMTERGRLERELDVNRRKAGSENPRVQP